MSTLYIVATPIGNRGDITLRALSILQQVHLILAEDTRTTQKLLSLYPEHEFDGQVLRLDDHLRDFRLANIVDQICQGVDAALVSEAGTPQISDPGVRLIQACIEKGVTIVPVPGPSALATVLSVANFATQPVVFYGFLPKKKGRETTFARLASFSGNYGARSAIVYESPERVVRTLDDLEQAFSASTRLVIGRELTKHFEEIWYGTIAEAKGHFVKPKGEFTILIELSDRSR